jgi:hypothetical protein
MIERMFVALADAVDGLDPVDDGASVAALVGLDDRLHAKVLASVAAFDAAGGWALDGAGSLSSWLKHHTDRSPGLAVGLARTARTLAELPETAAAYSDGRLSRGQLEAITANLSAKTVEHFAEHEAELLPVLVPLPANDAARVMQEWRARIDALLDEKPDAERARALHLAATFGRRWHGTLTLDDQGGTTLDTALALAFSDDAQGEPLRSFAEKRADALVDIARFYLDHRHDKPKGRHRPHINVVIDLEAMLGDSYGRLVGSGLLSNVDMKTLLCDCDIHRVLTDSNGVILDYGRATQTVPAPLFNAVALRDLGCRHPGCDAPVAWCDAHHITHWTNGGETNPNNLVLKCRRHHQLGHKRRWTEQLHPDGTLVITTETGHTMTSHPPGQLSAAVAA